MKASRYFGLIIVLTLLITLSQTMVRDSAGTAFTVSAYDIVGNKSGQGQGVLGFGESAQSATINAASCEQIDVQAAIDSASDGDTVIVPAGNCTWSGGVGIPDDKKITLQGAGISNTIISIGAYTAVGISTSGSRVSGFEFNIDSSSGGGVSAAGTGWRVDHCEFDFRTAGGKGIGIRAFNINLYYPIWELSGLVDNCVFYDGRNLASGSAVPGVSDPTKSWAIWSAPTDLGGPSAVYFEDNTFYLDQFGNIMDGNYGGVYVFRFNTIIKGPYSGDVVGAHSLQCTCRGFKKWEIYGNAIHGEGCWTPFFLRGGTGVIFDNTVTGTWNHKHITMDNRRSFDDVGGEAGACNGTSSWDGNEGVGEEAGYPCRDQIGRGADSYSWPASAPYPPQPLEPVYAYGNTPSDVTVSVNSNSAHHIKANRDYYDYTASFDGTSGVGTGTLANRPSTCTTGVAYWATDQGEWNSENPGADGQLYKCTSTDTWELYYIPYTYPHPLRGESLVLRATPADQSIHLTWQVGASLPATSTWQIAYDGPAGDQPSPISSIINPTRAYTLTGLTNYTWYTVTLNAMSGSTPFLTGTVRVMPSDIFVYLPIVLKGP